MPWATNFQRRLVTESLLQAALASGATFTDDTAVVEAMGHPVRTVLYNGINLKVTTPGFEAGRSRSANRYVRIHLQPEKAQAFVPAI